MTLIELQEKLGQQINDLTDPRVPFESEQKLGDSNIMEMVNGGYALMKKNPDGSIEGKTLK